jgi:hypothetical protein
MFSPSAPYGSSEAVNALNPSQPGAVNPQQSLLPPNFQSAGSMSNQTPALAGSAAGAAGGLGGAQPNPFGTGQANRLRGLFG